MAACRPLSDHEVTLVLASFEGRFAKRNRALFLFGIRTGFRISEILSLKVSDVYQHGAMKSQVTVEAKNMKGGRTGRTIVLHEAAKKAIHEYLREYEETWDRPPPPDMYLFKSQQGANRPLSRSQVAHFLHDIFDRHHFQGKLGTHTFRKVFAQKMWILLGKDIVRVQASLGHANINSTVRYLQNFSREEIDHAILNA